MTLSVQLFGIEAAGDALRSYFLPSFRVQLDLRSSPTVAQIEKTSEGVEGSDFVLALRYGRQGGVGSRLDTDPLPTPHPRQTKQIKLTTKNVFAVMNITDKTIEASKTNKAAFANLLATQLKDCETDAKEYYTRTFFGDGTGAITQVTKVESNVLTVSAVGGIAEGLALDSFAGDTAHGSKMRVLSVDEDALTVTVDNAGTTAKNDWLYVNGSKDKEMTGFEAVFRNNTLYGLDRVTAYPWLRASRKNVNGEISEVGIQEGIDIAANKVGSEIDYIMVSYGVRRAYQNLLTAQKMQVNTLDLKGGWKALHYNGIPFVAEKFTAPGTIRMLQLSNWKLYQVDDWDWMDRDGAVLHRVSGYAAYEATLRKYCELGCDTPRGQVELYGVNEW